jgi:hypothetical protein
MRVFITDTTKAAKADPLDPPVYTVDVSDNVKTLDDLRRELGGDASKLTLERGGVALKASDPILDADRITVR